AASFGGVVVGATVRVWIRNVLDTGEESAKAFALCRFGRGKGKRAHGAAVKAAVERDELIALGGVTRELHGAFDGFGAGVGEESFFRVGAGNSVDEFLGELWQAFIIEIRAGHVNQLGRLLLDCFDYLRMAMTGGADGDAGSEIQKGVAVNIFHDRAVAALGDERIVARERR